MSILFGVVVLIWPTAGLVTVIWIIGIWAVVWGIILIVLGVKLRKAAARSRQLLADGLNRRYHQLRR